MYGLESGRATTTGKKNTFIGTYAGRTNIIGDSNVFLGFNAGYDVLGSSNVCIGYEAGKNETGSAKLYIDNSNTASPLIHGDFLTNILTINGNLNMSNNDIYGVNKGTFNHMWISSITGTSPINIQTELNMSNQAITDINWASSDDGTGSSLDADLIDGYNYDYFETTTSPVSIEFVTLFHGAGNAQIYKSSDATKSYGNWWNIYGQSQEIYGVDFTNLTSSTDAAEGLSIQGKIVDGTLTEYYLKTPDTDYEDFDVQVWNYATHFDSFTLTGGTTDYTRTVP